MGSFVPFGGFFPSTSDFESPRRNKNQSTGRCNLCNEKYEQEASIVLKGGPAGSVSDRCSSNISSWLQMAESNKSKRLSTEEVAAPSNAHHLWMIKNIFQLLPSIVH